MVNVRWMAVACLSVISLAGCSMTQVRSADIPSTVEATRPVASPSISTVPIDGFSWTLICGIDRALDDLLLAVDGFRTGTIARIDLAEEIAGAVSTVGIATLTLPDEPPPFGVEGTARLTDSEEALSRLRVALLDGGPGITEDVLDDIVSATAEARRLNDEFAPTYCDTPPSR